ncbi:MAG: hypothetical protein COY42_33525 [Armatimonadetes bacterium CG_4_10_14_0_8_um_filter_66_14]|nr:MAG: hypothetical protein COY42_33525 [Armatimonadetes bacterium CG_4_10_14_0_8_um_filter_66_14]
MLTTLTCSLFALALPASAAESPSTETPVATDLRCEYRTNPLGIDVPKPRLSWRLTAGRQTAYQVVVDGLWDSGKVESDQSLSIEYAGKALRSSQCVAWKVRVWPGGQWSEPATWTMGVLAPEEWQAEWIGAPEAVTGERTPRGYHAAEATREDEVKWVQVDLGRSQPLAAIRLVPMRHADRDGFGFPVRFKVEISDDPQFRKAVLIADQTAADYPNPGLKPVAFDANGAVGRYVRVTATKLGKFTTKYCFALSQLEVVADGRNVAKGAPVTALDGAEDWGGGRWRSPMALSAPVRRRSETTPRWCCGASSP